MPEPDQLNLKLPNRKPHGIINRKAVARLKEIAGVTRLPRGFWKKANKEVESILIFQMRGTPPLFNAEILDSISTNA
jgi:hypothetical protein